MTYTYTPQAGDVIESPRGNARTKILSVKKRMITFQRYVCNSGAWVAGSVEETGQMKIEHQVWCKGWKLVARKDQ